jgi:hypothetical protein
MNCSLINEIKEKLAYENKDSGQSDLISELKKTRSTGLVVYMKLYSWFALDTKA